MAITKDIHICHSVNLIQEPNCKFHSSNNLTGFFETSVQTVLGMYETDFRTHSMAGGGNVYEVGSANQFTLVFDVMMVNGTPLQFLTRSKSDI